MSGPCKHGSNPRQCYTCELEARIAELEDRLALAEKVCEAAEALCEGRGSFAETIKALAAWRAQK